MTHLIMCHDVICSITNIIYNLYKKTTPEDELILNKFISKTRDIYVEGLEFGTVNRTSQ